MEVPKASSKGLQDYQLLKELGRGAYGTVYQARNRSTNRVLVVKMICLRSMKAATRRTAFREVTLMKSLCHPNIIRYEHSFCDEANLYIVMEFAEKGDLGELIKSRKYKGAGGLSQAQLWRMAGQLLSGLSYLHERNIIHRDMKTSNIFISADGTLKIGDLGVSKIVNCDALEHTRIGTPLYLAPQLIRHEQYDFKVDMWGLGCIFYLLATLEHPFKGKNIFHLGQVIVKEQPDPLPNKLSESFHRLVKLLLEKNSKARPDCRTLLNTFHQLTTSFPTTPAKCIDNLVASSTKQLLKTIKCPPDQRKLELSKTKLNIGHLVDMNSNSRVTFEGETRCEPPTSPEVLSKEMPKRQSSESKTKRIEQTDEMKKMLESPLRVDTPREKKSATKPTTITEPNEAVEFQEASVRFEVPATVSVVSQCRRPVSAAICRNKLPSNSITLKDLLKVKNNGEIEQVVMSRPRFDQAFSQLDILAKDDCIQQSVRESLIEPFVRPSHALQSNRRYKHVQQQPEKQKSASRGISFSKSFARPKCPTIELRKPDLIAVRYIKRFED